MKYEFKKVMDGLAKYVDDEIYSNMNDWQEFTARLLLGRIISNEDAVKESLISNGLIRTCGIIDSEGMVDVDTLARDLKRELARKGKLTLSIPMFGTLTFTPSDVDVLHKTITGEVSAQ
jgi:hypothetical protein